MRRTIALSFCALTIGCGGSDPTGPVLDLSGDWSFTANISNAELSVSCSSTGSANLVHSASTFSGSLVFQRFCSGPDRSFEDSGTGRLVGGQVNGNEVSFHDDGELGCSYTGTVSGSNQMSGTTICAVAISGLTLTFTGPWKAGKL